MNITGISGMNIGDGAGGKVALSITEATLRILADKKLSYVAATIANPADVKYGTAFYRMPELLQTEDYGDGLTKFDTPQIGGRSINLDRRITAKWTYEEFDPSRIEDGETLINMVAGGLATSIENSLNAEFLTYLVSAFEANGELANSNQVVTLAKLAKKIPLADFSNMDAVSSSLFGEYYAIEYAMNDIATKFDKRHAGVAKSEIISFVAPLVDINLRAMFYRQPNTLAEWIVSPTLQGVKVGNWKYFIDNQLLQNFVANQSFSKKAFDFSKYAGFLLHNEAVAMPMNFNTVIPVRDTENGNPRFIAKIQFGLGLLRPELIYALKTK